MTRGDDLLAALAAERRETEAAADLEAHPDWREATAPFDDATLDRLTDAVMAARGPVEAAGPDGDAPIDLARRRRRWIWAGGALAAAAALALFLAQPAPPFFTSHEGNTLDGYTMTVEAGDREMRGDEGEGATTLRPRSRFELVLRPAERRARPEVSTSLVRDGAREPWDVSVQRDEGGAVRIAGTAEALFGDRAGRWTVEVELSQGDARQTFTTEIALTGP